MAYSICSLLGTFFFYRIGRTGRVGNPGHATAFFNDNSGPVSRDLVELLEENGQMVPSWLQKRKVLPKMMQKEKWHQRYCIYVNM